MSSNSQDRQAQGESLTFSPNFIPGGINASISTLPACFPGIQGSIDCTRIQRWHVASNSTPTSNLSSRKYSNESYFIEIDFDLRVVAPNSPIIHEI